MRASDAPFVSHLRRASRLAPPVWLLTACPGQDAASTRGEPGASETSAPEPTDVRPSNGSKLHDRRASYHGYCRARLLRSRNVTAQLLSDVIRERSSEILAGWIVRFERSPLRFRRATKAAAHTAQVANLVEALGVAASSSELRPGSSATRELERNAAFLGAQFASEGATGFDIAALMVELRDVVASMVAPEK